MNSNQPGPAQRCLGVSEPVDSLARRPDGFRRVAQALADLGHGHLPLWLDVSARTSQEAAAALGVATGQIAKSVVFRRIGDDAAVLVIASGDRRVDERKLAALVGTVGRADADFVKQRTGFAIGGVAPIGHTTPPVTLIDSELLRFADLWAAAGHPNGVFRLTPGELQRYTAAPLADVVVLA
jgi:prolyl-tRNA editing enzyme YbaK/EbsC (Cys-tRNA(Pro) deacylase)